MTECPLKCAKLGVAYFVARTGRAPYISRIGINREICDDDAILWSWFPDHREEHESWRLRTVEWVCSYAGELPLSSRERGKRKALGLVTIQFWPSGFRCEPKHW